MADESRRSRPGTGSSGRGGKKRGVEPAHQTPALQNPDEPSRPPPPLRPSQSSPFAPPLAGPLSSAPGRPPKIAIPRLYPEAEARSTASASPLGADRHRVGHACEPCRARKTKCSGERPRCSHCREHELVCAYGDGKRDRAKKEMGSLQERVEEYEQLLERLSLRGDSATQTAIRKVLRKSSTPRETSTSSTPTTGPKWNTPRSVEEEDEPAGEDLVGAEVGSTGSLDRFEQDFGSEGDSLPPGFMGKATEESWMQRVATSLEAEASPGPDPPSLHGQESLDRLQGPDAARPGPQHGGYSRGGTTQLGHFAFDADDFDLSTPDDLSELDLPPRSMADLFVTAYFTTVHTSFPLVLRSSFFLDYQRSYASHGPPVNRQSRAVLNLILAIGAKYSALLRVGQCDEHDHMTFFARARSLSLDGSAMLRAGDLEQVQVAGLSALYLITAEQINRAWNVCGLAIRYAQSLGLHLRNSSSRMSDVQKEVRVRLWWSICSLERLLELRTGRPSAIHPRDFSTPMPVPIPEESFPTDGSPLFINPLEVNGPLSPQSSEAEDDGAGHSAGSQRAAPSRSTSWSGRGGASSSASPAAGKGKGKASTSASRSRSSDLVRASEALSRDPLVANSATDFILRLRLDMILHDILSSLFSPRAARRTWAEAQQLIGDFQRQLFAWQRRLPARFNFRRSHQDAAFARERLGLGLMYWSTVIVVTRPCLCRSDNQIPNESATSKDSRRATAVTCVHAAEEILKFFPDEPDPMGFYRIVPWWKVVHHLAQAATVFLAELSYHAYHLPQEADQILAAAKKAVHWLWAMSQYSVAAGRAWRTIDHLLRQIAPLIGGDASDMPRLNPAAMVPLMCEALPLGPTQIHLSRQAKQQQPLLRQVPGQRPTSGYESQPVWSGLDLTPGHGLENFYQPSIFLTYDQPNPLAFTFPDSSLMFPSFDEETEDMEIDRR